METTGSTLLVTNQYPWGTFYKREGRSWEDNLKTALGEVKQSGADSLEPSLRSVEQLDELCSQLDASGLGMITAYVNSTLHEQDQANQSIEEVLAIAKRAKALMGTKIFVTNPSPIRWGGPENKTDEQLMTQAEALQALGKALHEEDIHLAYHFHDPEFREGAREVHHMLAGTDPRYVKLCLDAHWAYRGAGDSNVALHDLVSLYGSRIVELHIRQSHNGVWSEAFGGGDIDYNRLVKEVNDLGVKPVVCMEQAVEKTSPNTMNGLEAHRISHSTARKVFKPFLSA
ncbi:MAG: sugar phosphate isomerase/epimerase family protein [Puniceicoccaceae bacterium]